MLTRKKEWLRICSYARSYGIATGEWVGCWLKEDNKQDAQKRRKCDGRSEEEDALKYRDAPGSLRCVFLLVCAQLAENTTGTNPASLNLTPPEASAKGKMSNCDFWGLTLNNKSSISKFQSPNKQSIYYFIT